MGIPDKTVDQYFIDYGDRATAEALNVVEKIVNSPKNATHPHAPDHIKALIIEAQQDQMFLGMLHDFQYSEPEKELREEWRQGNSDLYLENFRNYTEGDYEKYVRPLLKYFLEQTIPSDFMATDEGYVLPDKVISLHTKTNQIDFEDLYKVRDALQAIAEREKSNTQNEIIPDYAPQTELCGKFKKQSFTPASHIDSYLAQNLIFSVKNLLSDQIRRDQNAAFKKELKSGKSSLVYSGEEGKVYMIHDKNAAKKQGFGTKWCISAKDDRDNLFDSYNDDGPIFFFMPKLSKQEKQEAQSAGLNTFKHAFAYQEKGIFRNELDEKASPSGYMSRLINAAAESLVPGQKEYFLQILSSYHRPDNYSEEERANSAAWKQQIEEAQDVDNSLLSNGYMIFQLHRILDNTRLPSLSVDDYTQKELSLLKKAILEDKKELLDNALKDEEYSFNYNYDDDPPETYEGNPVELLY